MPIRPANGSPFDQLAVAELHSGDVDRDLERFRPRLSMLTCGVQHPLADRDYQAGLFGKGNELAGRNEALPRMPPAQQCFKSADLLVLQIDLWLEVQLELWFATARRRSSSSSRRAFMSASISVRSSGTDSDRRSWPGTARYPHS